MLAKNLGAELAGKTHHFVNTVLGQKIPTENLGTELAGKTHHFVNTVLGQKSWQRIWAQNLQARHDTLLTLFWARNPGKESRCKTCRQDTTLC